MIQKTRVTFKTSKGEVSFLAEGKKKKQPEIKDRPWGKYTVLESSKSYKIKRITVDPGKQISKQYHHHRDEHWVIVSGIAEVIIDNEKKLLGIGESISVRSCKVHRLKNPGILPLEVIEVSTGEYLGEDDIIRLDDDFGRSTCNENKPLSQE